MSCNSCGSQTGCGCTPAPCSTASCDPSNESLNSQLSNFITSFYGVFTKICVAGKVAWELPCNLDAGIPGFPRLPNEGTACYLIRLFTYLNNIVNTHTMQITEIFAILASLGVGESKSYGTGRPYTLFSGLFNVFAQHTVPAGKVLTIATVEINTDAWGVPPNTVVEIYNDTTATLLLSTAVNFAGSIVIPAGNRWYARVINNNATPETVTADVHGFTTPP